MQQPSAQGIASLFRGNPAPLQQRIQNEQQGKPGLPPDLQKLLALNIVTNEKDAVAKQQAMDQLNQMQGQQGKPPTVMQTVQEQARQKMQAQQVQAQQQQQAMQAMAQQAGPGPVPPGTPQPQSQPQGIDELPVEFSMAEGGIIAFQEGKRVPRIQDEPTISDEERAQLERELLMRIIGEEARNPPERKVPMQMTESDLMSVPGMEQSDLMARALRDAAGPQPDNRAMLNAIERREPRAPYTGPKSESLNERVARQMEEKGSIYDKDFGIPPAERAAREARRQEAISQIPTGGEPTVTGGERVRGSETERNILNTLAALPGAGAAKATTAGRQALAGIASLLGMDKSSAPERVAPAAAAQSAPSPAEESGYSREGRTGARPYTPAPKPVQDLKSLAEKERRQQAPRPVPVAATPTPTPQATAPEAGITAALPAAESQAARMMQERMDRDPNAIAANREMMYQSRVGAPDVTQRDAAIRALEEERRRYAEPEGGFAGLMEYLGQIAATPRGMSSFEAGAAGARGVQAAQKQRADQRMAIGMKIIEQEQGKIDASRQYAKDVFGIGDAAYNQAYKEQFEAAKQITSNENEAAKLAQQNTLKQLELQQEMKRKEMDIEQRKAEEKGRAARDRVPLEQQVFAGYLKQAGGDVAKAYEAMKAAGVSSSAKPMTRDQASDNVTKALENFGTAKTTISDAKSALLAAGVSNPTMAQIKEHLIQEQMRGVSLAGSGGPTPQQTGKVPPPPPGFKVN